nr:hypothetical protein Iba_chr01bCG14700 [Ipomoea batatas]GME02048.1 hypothetical protein Iba_contig3595CG0010 [Ipomoea batatas]
MHRTGLWSLSVTSMQASYCKIEDTTGQSKLHVVTELGRLSRYKILSHQAGIRFFSPESYPAKPGWFFSNLYVGGNLITASRIPWKTLPASISVCN